MKYLDELDEDFTCMDLRKREFLGSKFVGCDFSFSNLEGAYICGAIFDSCVFNSTILDKAYIFCSQFKNCYLIDASMELAMLSSTEFISCDFDKVKWKEGIFINSAPTVIEGIEYPVTALDNGYMQVGCEFNTYEWFWNTDEKHSAAMEGLKARRFWKKNKQWIFDMLKARGLYET